MSIQNRWSRRSFVLSLIAANVAFFGWQMEALEPVKDFSLTAPGSEKVFKLSEQKGRFVVLHFLLKTECPICQRHMKEYLSRGGELPNTVQVFIKPDSEAEIREWSAKMPREVLKENPVYRDVDAGLAKRFGIPDGYKFHGQVVHYPALILIGPDGKEVFRHIGKNNADRYPLEKLKAAIEGGRK